MSVNKVILLGNLGKNPEVRYLDNNKIVANFTVATSETYTNRNGERQTDTEWHNIEVWDSLARIAEKYLKKGNQVYLEGKLRTERWTDKEGQERIGKKIRATSLTLLGGRTQSDSADSNDEQTHQPENGHTNQTNHPQASHEDDLPF
jgi:single-strand DNA-binding protein